ncbi:MBL fold metallo-hydrolase [Archaeoglobus profundus]|uniref:Beta-lactamase domain protein n=1 Tax=Archaeoglobus profundus (strain DSM 5631 / JCM 9629 / NBRC 100127 / Av18) TaxID=572546 RepID=D2RGG9_ARCPA|nr:ribonuclease Z [Archaeoglobus profundus]ADB57394.1 beta-lactamase domain protein [Archaeoglobus profundus DSM 5631]
MLVKFVGVGTAVKGIQSCIVLEGENTKIAVDIGAGSIARLDFDLDAVLITHNHSDHNSDLIPLLKARWLLGYEKLDIYGVRGTKAFLESALESYAYLRRKLKFDVHETRSFKVGEFDVKAIPTKHSIESQAYVVSDGNVTIVVSGDTYPIEDVLSVECDLLIHEMSLPFGYETNDHTTPESFADLLDVCKAKKIVFVHMYPMALEVKDEILKYLRRRKDLSYYIAREGEVINTAYQLKA